MLLLCDFAYADKVHIPFTCWPIKIIKEGQKCGLKIDKNGDDRTVDSFAHIENNGSYYYIVTYESATIEELDKIKNIAFIVEKYSQEVRNGKDNGS